MVPSNIIPTHSGTGDQTTGIKLSSDTQNISNASSEQTIRAVGYQGNNETTFKILNASLRESTRTKYSIYVRQWKLFIGAIRDINIEHILNLLNNLYDESISYSAIVTAKCALGNTMTVATYQSLNDHPLIIKFITGMYNFERPAPKLSFV